MLTFSDKPAHRFYVLSLRHSFISSVLVFLFLMSFGAISFSAKSAEGNEDLYGTVTAQEILALASFQQEYERYQPTSLALDNMQSLEDKELVVLFGSWCHDSEREVPRLLKLLDASGVALANVMLLAVDKQKHEASGIAEELSLRFTPTFVVRQDGKEIARIIERPQVDLAADFAHQISLK